MPGTAALRLETTRRETAKLRELTPPLTIDASRGFALCQHCHKPTLHREPICVNCGARLLQRTALHAQELNGQRFLHAVLARQTLLVYAIFFLNQALYLLMAMQAPGALTENLVHGVDGVSLLAFGAKTNAALLNSELFRLITPVFLHSSGLHLLANSLALLLVGPQVERLYGSARFLAFYLLAGLGGMMGSTVAHALDGKRGVVVVGASGAIFGLFGVLAAFSFKHRKELPAPFINSVARAVLPAIGVSLLIGFSVPLIDNSTQIGGLLAGVLLAFMIPYLAPERERFSRARLALMAVWATVLAGCIAYTYPSSPHSLRASRAVVPETVTLIP